MTQFRMLRRWSLSAVVFTLSLVAVMVATAQDSNVPMNNEDIQWGPAPDFLPEGAEFALLDGDPASDKQLTIRLRFPAGYEVPAHWHPTQENVTVLSGTLYAGMGDELDKENSMALEPGGYVAIPAEMHHFA